MIVPAARVPSTVPFDVELSDVVSWRRGRPAAPIPLEGRPMQMLSTRRGRSLAAWAATGALCLLVPAARADEAYTLAISKAHKLQILADGGTAWCGQHLSLRMVLDPESPDVGNPRALVGMMNRLKMPISTDCKIATSAALALVAQGNYHGKIADDGALSASWGSYKLVGHIADDAETDRVPGRGVGVVLLSSVGCYVRLPRRAG
jgi:hypothetical protein